MGSRTATNLLVLELAGFLVVACFAFSPATVGWLGLGIGCAVEVIALAGFALRYRGVDQRALDLIAALLTAWLIVATRAFGASTARWLDFSAAVALVALATLGIVLADRLRGRQLRAAASRPVHHDGNGHTPAGFVFSGPEPLRPSGVR